MKKIMVWLLAGSLMIGSLSGCGAKQNGAGETNASYTSYPIETNEELSWWIPLTANVSAISSSIADTPFAAQLEKETGVKIRFVHPPQGQEMEKFNLMVASNEMEDIISYNWYYFSGGGARKAIDEEYILPLNELMDQYAPNLKAYLEANPEVDKMVKTDNGDYYVFPFLRGDEILCTYKGLMLRADWLKQLGLSVPETMDEWTTVLTTFKEKKGATAPLSFMFGTLGDNSLTGAFHTATTHFIDENGTVKYGPIEAGYKDYLALMNKWYTNGLLDPNITTVDTRILDSNVLGGKTGATIAAAGSGIGKWIPAMAQENPEFDLVAAPSPVLKKGERPWFGNKDFMYLPENSTAISAECKNPALAAKFLDYGYGEKGHLLYNFGISGESYTMENDEPVYTDKVMKNSDMVPAQAIAQYSMGSYYGPFVSDKRYIEQFYTMPQQQNAIRVWNATDNEKHVIPFTESLPEENTNNTRIMNEVTTYVAEMTLKFITGVESLDRFDAYVEKCKQYGIDTVTASNQAALDRYNKR